MAIVRRPSPFWGLESVRSAMDHRFEGSVVRRPAELPAGSGDGHDPKPAERRP